MDEVADEIPIPENETSVVIPLTSFAISVQEVDPGSFSGQDFAVDFGNEFNFDEDTKIDANALNSQSSQPTASLSIPQNIFMSLNFTALSRGNGSSPLPRITNSVFLTDVLFARRNESKLVVGSIIMAASLSEGLTVRNLSPPIELLFVKKPSVLNGSGSSCNFWDLGADG